MSDRRAPDRRNSPYPLSRLDAPIDLVEAAREIQRAEATLELAVGARLQVIAEQMRHLRAEAERLLDKARRDAELHRAECHLVRRPGHVYHLYRRQDGSRYFSLLSPADWGAAPPHAFEGSYRLEPDMSWTRTDLEEDGTGARPVVGDSTRPRGGHPAAAPPGERGEA